MLRERTYLKESEGRKRKEKAIYRKFPADSKSRRRGNMEIMVTGGTARAIGRNDFDTVALSGLEDNDLEMLYRLVVKK